LKNYYTSRSWSWLDENSRLEDLRKFVKIKRFIEEEFNVSPNKLSEVKEQVLMHYYIVLKYIVRLESNKSARRFYRRLLREIEERFDPITIASL